MDYWVEKDKGDYIIYAGDRLMVAQSACKRDAVMLVQAMTLLEGIAYEFPGIVNGQDDVGGANLVDFFNDNMGATLRSYLAGRGDYKNDGDIVGEVEIVAVSSVPNDNVVCGIDRGEQGDYTAEVLGYRKKDGTIVITATRITKGMEVHDKPLPVTYTYAVDGREWVTEERQLSGKQIRFNTPFLREGCALYHRVGGECRGVGDDELIDLDRSVPVRFSTEPFEILSTSNGPLPDSTATPDRRTE